VEIVDGADGTQMHLGPKDDAEGHTSESEISFSTGWSALMST
jgi:hypothetical protein